MGVALGKWVVCDLCCLQRRWGGVEPGVVDAAAAAASAGNNGVEEGEASGPVLVEPNTGPGKLPFPQFDQCE